MAPATGWFRPFRTFAILVMTATFLLTTAPAASAEDPVDYIAGFEIVSTSVDVETGRPTVTYAFRCLEQVDYVRIRSGLVQRHAGVEDYGSTWQTSAVFDCPAGVTVTLSVGYGGQQGSYYPGPASLTADLYAYEGAYTVDSASLAATVRLHPSRPRS